METLVGLEPTFHIPNCLFIRQIYDLVAGPDGIFYLSGKPLRKAEIMGTVVKLYHFDPSDKNHTRGRGGVSVTVDDSTGLLECFCPTQLLTIDSEFATEQVAEFGDIIAAIKQPSRLVSGLLVRMRGLLYTKTIRPYQLRASASKHTTGSVVHYKKLYVTDLKVEHDPDALAKWILHVIRVSTEFLMAATPPHGAASYKPPNEAVVPGQPSAPEERLDVESTGRQRNATAALKRGQLDGLAKLIENVLSTSHIKQLPIAFARLQDGALRTSFVAALAACGWSAEELPKVLPVLATPLQPTADVVAELNSGGGVGCCSSIRPTSDALVLRIAPSEGLLGDSDDPRQTAWRHVLDELARRGIVYPSAKSAAKVWSVAANDAELLSLVCQAVKECDTNGAGTDAMAVRSALGCYVRYRHISRECVRQLLDKCVHDSLLVVCGSSSRGDRVTYRIV